MSNRDLSLDLTELPKSGRVITIGDSLMVVDNFDLSDPLSVLNFNPNLKTKLLEPFKIKFSMILLCVSGNARIRLNLREYTLTERLLLLTPAGAIAECLHLSPDMRIIMIAFSQSLNILDGNIRLRQGSISALAMCPLLNLSEQECQSVLSIYNIIRSRLEIPDFPAKREIAGAAIRLIFSYVFPHLAGSAPQNADNRLLDNFLTLVESHAMTNRSIRFYADELSVTPRHLSRVILRTSGKTVKQWINDRIILEAKVMLNEPNNSIQQISERLGFPNQSSFGTYFKKSTSVSPLNYRKNTSVSSASGR